MKRGTRVLVPLLVAVTLFGVYWFVQQSERLVDVPAAQREAVARVLLFVTCLALIIFLVRTVDLVAFDVFVRRRVRAPMLLREIVSIALFLILMAWAISSIFDYKVTAFLATGTVLAAVLGLALQETLGNLFAGIALHLEESFELGDVIRSGDHIGVVEAVRWRGTRIRTFNNNVVIVPNSMLARERLEVFPRKSMNARVLQIAIDSHVPPATVISVLTQAASNVDGVEREMPCFARIGSFGDSSLVYEIKYFTTDYSIRDRIDADIRRAVWYALRRNAIPIPFPVRSVIRYEAPAVRHPDHSDFLGRMAAIDILSPLSPEALQMIAEAARVHVYSKGETILRHGAEGNSMFVVHEGTVSVRVNDDEVARLAPGDFFGEMALLTGERRTADVIAVTDVVAMEIAKDALAPVLLDHPELAASISAKVVERRGTLDALRDEGREEDHGSVLSRIRAYFGLLK
jgi:small-conductance mechanosensitive channel/CRP-like cAMP-binding protein